jgi:hypothetical protein
MMTMPPDEADHCAALELHDLRPEDRRTHELLAAVLAEVHAMRCELAERRAPERVPRLHAGVAAPMLREISDAVGGTVWSGRELIDYAMDKDRQLLAAIEVACGPRDAGIVRRLGRLLAQVEGRPVDGYMVERMAETSRDGASWRVMRV